MTDRRYSEDEAAEIFRVAAELEATPRRAVVPTQGLTLAELQAIGHEAGLNPDLVARAARASAVTGSARTMRLLGFPIGVSRTIEVDAPMTEAAWERLVGDLRETFEAKGVLRQDGAFRQWSNGNLHVLVEPTATGHRLRFRTRNGLSQTLMTSGALTLVAAAAIYVTKAIAAAPDAVTDTAVVGAIGAGLLAFGALRLPPWARRRLEQMQELARRHFEGASEDAPRVTDHQT